MIGRERGDQLRDALAQLQREVGRRGAHELAHVLDRDVVGGGAALGRLGLAHVLGSPVARTTAALEETRVYCEAERPERRAPPGARGSG